MVLVIFQRRYGLADSRRGSRGRSLPQIETIEAVEFYGESFSSSSVFGGPLIATRRTFSVASNRKEFSTPGISTICETLAYVNFPSTWRGGNITPGPTLIETKRATDLRLTE